MPTISTELIGKDAAQRRRIKARRIWEMVVDNLPYTFTRDAYALTVHGISFNGNMLIIELEVTNDNDSWSWTVQVWNPPIMHPDGTTRTITNEFGEEQTVPNYAENPIGALRQLIFDEAKRYVRDKRGNVNRLSR